MNLETETLEMQPLTLQEDLSVKQKLFHFQEQAAQLLKSTESLTSESLQYFAHLRKQIQEQDKYPNQIQENLLDSFEQKEEKKINQNLAFQKGENNRMRVELGKIREEHRGFNRQLIELQEKLNFLEHRIGKRILQK